MTNRWLKLLSIFVSLVLIINLLPLQALASDIDETPQLPLSTLPEDGSSGSTTGYQRLDTATVVEEDTSRRGEYYKEFVLNNGLRLAAVYADPIHFEEDGQWKDIDNTLKAVDIKGISGYTNTAGVWQVYFPQQLTGSNAISVTKDGYTVSFGMAGELTNSGNIAVASIGDSSDILAVSSVRSSAAQIRAVDLTEQKAAAQYEQTVLEKHSSRLAYASVYNNTEIVYDLTGNRLKESIVMAHYDASLWGYRYNLNTGGLIPVLLEDNTIELRHPETAEVVMTMPAPFMVDANDEYSYDVDVSLVQKNGSYLLSYYVPRAWLASSDRAWPVVLDPVVDAENSYSNIQDISFTPTVTETYRHSTLKVGYSPSNGIYRTYIRFVELPDLSSADNIASAYITLRKPSTSSKSVSIEVHKVNQPWTDRTISWGNNDSFNDIVEDSITIQNPANYTWDITNIVRGWYEDTANLLANNTGMMFKTTNTVENAGESNWHQFCSSNYAQYVTGGEGTEPSLAIIINNTNGLEDYWDYTSVSAGRAGTGYIQNYSGNLVWVHNDMGFDGNRMPVSISHIYNPMLSGSNKYGLGYGWQTNYHQTVKQASDNSYVWTDGDGTLHYFYPTDTGVYQDEDNLRLTLSVATDKYTLTDQYGNTSEFVKLVNGTNQEARLTKQENNQSTKSSVNISYSDQSSKRISQITDGVGRVYAFVYSGDLLDKIEYKPSGDTVRYTLDFDHTDALLTSVKYADNKESFYTYNTKNLLTKVQNIDGYSINFTYGTSGADKLRRVMTVTEKYITETNDTLTGKQTTFSYGLCSTKVTTREGTDEQYQVYHFDQWGNTVSVYDEDGRAVVSKYKPVLQPGDPTHLVTATSSQQITVNNLLSNSSFEGTNMPWTAVGGSSPSRVLGNALLGEYSMRLSTGVNRIQSTAITAAPGESYTFSAYVMASSAEHVTIGIDVNGIVVATQSEPDTSIYTRISVSYTNDTSSNKSLRAVICGSETYEISVDCVQLEKGNAASRYNLIENGNFSDLTGWDTSDAPGSAYASGVRAPSDQQNAGSLKITGTPGTTQIVSQTVSVHQSGQRFVVTGWAKGSGLPTDGSTTRSFAVQATMRMSGGITSTVELPFTINNTDQWQYVAGEIGASLYCEEIEIELVCNDDCGTVYFDGIGLYWEKFGDSYAYDSNGNLATVEDQLMNTTRYIYYDNGVDVKTVNYPTGIRMEYTYDDITHNVLTAAEHGDGGQKSVTWFAYDAHGNVTATQCVVNTGGGTTSTQTTTSQYSTNGNYLIEYTDETGAKTKYGYDQALGLLEWVQYPGDTEATRTEYEYDIMFRPAKMETTTDTGKDMFAEYTYVNDQIATIRSPKTEYTMTYGAFGQRMSVGIGSRQLAQYEYSENCEERYLEKLEYGNGAVVKYEYDDKGRVISEKYWNTPDTSVDPYRTVTYAYNIRGLLATKSDSVTQTITRYVYDAQDRLIHRYGQNGYSAKYSYDNLGNVIKVLEDFGTTNIETEYSYDGENRPYRIVDDATTVMYAYDNLNRIVGRTAGLSGTTAVESTFAYESNSNRIYSLTVNGTVYFYNYDAKGNIISVSGGGNNVSYQYDSQNQLTRENNQAANRTWTWEYDAAGNILNKKEYAYTTGTLGSAISTVAYGYPSATNSETWKDLLLSYNGSAITYDTIGNPLSDDTWSYEWKQGRQLTKMSGSNGIWQFTYDADGLRTEKTNGDLTYRYIYSGGQLRYLEIERNDVVEHRFVFRYGVDGRPYSVRVQEEDSFEEYFYVLNLQGDVIGIVNTSGAYVVNYTYDAWGNILATTGSMASTLGQLNPLRYRSYVYDQETGLYYVSSRYYDPEIGRWISPEPNVYAGAFDSGSGLIGYNVYAYCANNPVNLSDPTGEFILTALIVGVVVGAVIGGAIGGTIAYNSAKSSGLEGSDLFWATAGGVGKGALIGGVAGGLVGATGGVVAAYGATSIAGTAMITATATITAKATEVTVLQAKKSRNDGDNGWQIANDCIDSVFSNGGKIISPALTKAGTTSATYVATNLIKHRAASLGVNTFLHSTGGKVLPYGSALLAWGYTGYAIFCSDPIAVANQRGYGLR